MHTYEYVPAVGTVNVKLRADRGGPEPGGALGGSVPVLNRSVALRVWGEGPGLGFCASGLSGSVGTVCLPANVAVWGAPELFTNTTLSLALMLAGTGA